VRSTRLSNHERACLFYDASRDLTSTLRVCLGRIRYFLEAAARLKRVRFSVNCPRILQLRSRRHALGYGEQPSDQGDWSLSIGPPWQHWVSLYETPFRKAELVRRSSFSDSPMRLVNSHSSLFEQAYLGLTPPFNQIINELHSQIPLMIVVKTI
jgi:hypothetical protein